MSEKRDDFCPESAPCGQKQTRRWWMRAGATGAVATVAAALGLNLHGALQDAKAGDRRPFTDDELDAFFADPRQRTPGFLGNDRDPAEVFTDIEERTRAFDAKDTDYFRPRLFKPVDQKIAEAAAHTCGGTYDLKWCHVHFWETRYSQACGPLYGYNSCWAFHHCHSDGHAGYCYWGCNAC